MSLRSCVDVSGVFYARARLAAKLNESEPGARSQSVSDTPILPGAGVAVWVVWITEGGKGHEKHERPFVSFVFFRGFRDPKRYPNNSHTNYSRGGL